MKCPVEGAQAAKAAGKTDLCHGQLGVCQQPHRILRAEPPEIVAVGTAKLVLKDMGDVIFAVAKGAGEL